MTEQEIEQALIEKLGDLKYKDYQPPPKALNRAT